MKITKDMTFAEVIKKYPETIDVFLKHGLHCIGCPIGAMETIEQGAKAHRIDVEKLLEELNEVIKRGNYLNQKINNSFDAKEKR